MSKIDPNLAKEFGAPVTFGSPGWQRLIEAVSDAAEPTDRDRSATQDMIALIRAARLGALRLPREEGGGGSSLPELFETVLLLAEADSNIPHILRNHFAFTERALRLRGNPKFSRWLDEVRDGRLFGHGSSELGTANIGNGLGETRLTRHGDGYRLTGQKYYSTGNFYFDAIYVQAQTEDGASVAVLVPTDRAGVTIPDDWDGIGQRRTASGTTILSDVEVSADEIVSTAEEATRLPHDATFPQLYLTTIVAGILRAVVRDAKALILSRERSYYHAPAARPADDPLLQRDLGRLASVAYVAEASVLRAVDALAAAYTSVAQQGQADVGLFREAALRAAKAKVVVDELALSAAGQLFDVGGASAATQRKRLDRHWRNIRTLSSHNPLSYKARAIGQHTLDGTALPNRAFF